MVYIINESKDSKYIIYFDQDSNSIGKKLEDKGYIINYFNSGTPDNIINEELNKLRNNKVKEKPILFVTANAKRDFSKFSIRKYFLVRIPNGFLSDEQMADKIKDLLSSNNNGIGFHDGIGSMLLKISKSGKWENGIIYNTRDEN